MKLFVNFLFLHIYKINGKIKKYKLIIYYKKNHINILIYKILKFKILI